MSLGSVGIACPLSHSDSSYFGWLVIFLDGLFGVFPDIVGKFVTGNDVVFARLGHLQIGIGRLAADDADTLEILNSLFVCFIQVDGHFQSTVLFAEVSYNDTS